MKSTAESALCEPKRANHARGPHAPRAMDARRPRVPQALGPRRWRASAARAWRELITHR
jgi:hypothetical protein